MVVNLSLAMSSGDDAPLRPSGLQGTYGRPVTHAEARPPGEVIIMSMTVTRVDDHMRPVRTSSRCTGGFASKLAVPRMPRTDIGFDGL
jgi:hypothetical protein